MKHYTLPQLPVLEDFALFLTFLRSHEKIPATNSNAHLKQTDLVRLNSEMHYKAIWANERNMQPHYPLLDFFYHVAQAGGLIRTHHEAKGVYLRANPERLEKYDLLTPTEQYFFLLETAWCRLNWGEIQESRSWYFAGYVFAVLRLVAENAPGHIIEIQDKSIDIPGRKYGVHLPAARKLLEIFAFLDFYELEADASLTKKPDRYTFPYTKFITSELGHLLAPVLLQQRPLKVWNLFARDNDMDLDMLLFSDEPEAPEEEVPLPDEPFIEAFQPLFAAEELSEDFYTEEPEFIAGRYTINVSFSKKLYRTIAIGASATLDDLHLAIQEAFAFDDDHLYAFFMDGKRWSDYSIYDPRGDTGPFADKIKIGDLNLYEGRRFVYLFDFGDCWEFELLVQKIEPNAPEPTKAAIVAEKGEAPEQYGGYEEEDGEDW